jgi:hypothetical protein
MLLISFLSLKECMQRENTAYVAIAKEVQNAANS